jgi:hypothetical protein
MAEATDPASGRHLGTPLAAASGVVRIPVVVLGLSLGLFFLITYVLCVSYDLIFPGQAMYQSWLRLLPGFTWLNWPSFLLGLAVTSHLEREAAIGSVEAMVETEGCIADFYDAIATFIGVRAVAG